VATYALFGMMNWIYNWYDPQGKLTVSDLAGNVMKLFLNGFLADGMRHSLPIPSESPSVWSHG
jgi:TetR/AcrR family transcriptional regulator, cholesterol catabolism regulator